MVTQEQPVEMLYSQRSYLDYYPIVCIQLVIQGLEVVPKAVPLGQRVAEEQSLFLAGLVPFVLLYQ